LRSGEGKLRVARNKKEVKGQVWAIQKGLASGAIRNITEKRRKRRGGVDPVRRLGGRKKPPLNSKKNGLPGNEKKQGREILKERWKRKGGIGPASLAVE